jgi:hypothetical protein
LQAARYLAVTTALAYSMMFGLLWNTNAMVLFAAGGATVQMATWPRRRDVA